MDMISYFRLSATKLVSDFSCSLEITQKIPFSIEWLLAFELKYST